MEPTGAFFVENARSRSRWATQPFLSRKITTSKQKYDRFIPNRSSMDMELANFLLTQTEKEKELNKAELSPSKDAYRKRLVEVVLQNRTRILSFNSKPLNDHNLQHYAADRVSSDQLRFSNRHRWIPRSAERMLDAPDIVDDHCLNLLDWGSNNVLAIALGNSVYLWDASGGLASELMYVNEDHGPVTSVSWAPDGRTIAIGLNNSEIQLWDSTSARRLRTLKGIHQSRVGSLSWNNRILTTGGADGKITNNDVRIRSHVVQTYVGHRGEVCGLKWSGSGRSLASGGNDNLLHIWDVSMASSSTASRQEQWLHRFDHHKAAVRALAWCPFQSSLLASGGAENDRCIKFWNANTGACLNSVDTGSSVCALLWNKNERELLSSHGLTRNQLTLWRYPSMVKMAELMGHTSRVLFMSQSPDGCTVASASGDESLQLWNVFGTPGSQKPTTNAQNAGNVSRFDHIR